MIGSRLLSLAFGVAIAVSSATFANASLIGDTVTIRYFNPSGTEVVGYGFPTTVTGAAGTSDVIVDSFPSGPYFSVDLEADSISVDFLKSGSFTPPSDFDGIRIEGIDSLIASVVFSGIGIGTFGTDWIAFNWHDLPFSSSSFSKATITFASNALAAVPVPATLPLLGGGLAFLGLLARKRRTKTVTA